MRVANSTVEPQVGVAEFANFLQSGGSTLEKK